MFDTFSTLDFEVESQYVLKAIERFTRHLIQSSGRWLGNIQSVRTTLNQDTPITGHDIERYAKLWQHLVPNNDFIKLRVAYSLSKAYSFDYEKIPMMRQIFGLDEFGKNFQYQYGISVEEAFSSKESQPERVESETLNAFSDVLQWKRYKRGEVIFRQGDPGDSLYVVASGRLCVLMGERIVEWAGQGKIIGELALLTREPRAATVIAARDSLLLELARDDFEKLVDSQPKIMAEIVRMIAERLRAGQNRKNTTTFQTIAIVPLHEKTDFASQLASIMRKKLNTLYLTSYNLNAKIFGDQEIMLANHHDNDLIVSWLNEQEADYPFIIYEADLGPTTWTKRCLLQADYVLFVGNAAFDPAVTLVEQHIPADQMVVKDLLLVHQDDDLPSKTAAWLEHRQISKVYHSPADLDQAVRRIARRITGRSVGLALGGGGARCFAHAGVIRAFIELGIPIDVIGTTSAAAILAGAYGMGYTVDRILDEGKQLLAKPVDYTLPIISLAAGKRLNDALVNGFRDIHIEDLWVEFFCISANLTRAKVEVHDKGLMRYAVRATISLPGIFPPVISNRSRSELLIDGGILNNVPVDVVAEKCNGYIFASDVFASDAAADEFDADESLSGFQYLWNRFSPFSKRRYKIPGMLPTLMRIGTISSQSARSTRQQTSDVYLMPDLSKFALFDVDKAREIAQAGYENAKPALTAWMEQHPDFLSDVFCD